MFLIGFSSSTTDLIKMEFKKNLKLDYKLTNFRIYALLLIETKDNFMRGYKTNLF